MALMMSGRELIARIRGYHKDCGGCPVEQLCDEYELALNGAAVLLTPDQAAELREYLGNIIDRFSDMPHDLYDEAYHFLTFVPSEKEYADGIK